MTESPSIKQIIILSPHFDDAALSCSDHILKWLAQGHDVTIITIFTKFRTPVIPEFLSLSMRQSGFTSLRKYEHARKNEDLEAMRLLGVKFVHLSFTDGGFRHYKNQPLYPTSQDLFSGRLHPQDKKLAINTQTLVAEYIPESAIVVMPFGVGSHVDHVIARQVGENLSSLANRWYYLDQPYALDKTNLTIRLRIKRFWMKRNVLPISEFKKQVLDCYPSQMKVLFTQDGKIDKLYEEILSSQKIT